MKPRPWQDVLYALQSLGVEKVHESEKTIMLCRGAAKLKALPRTFRVSVVIQDELLSAFGLSRDNFLRCIPIPSKSLIH